MNPVLVVAAVIENDGRLLICQRPAEKHHGGLWEFPGGKVHAGESLAEALERELAEELSVRVTHSGQPVFRSKDAGAGVEILFIPTVVEGEPQALEHSALAWCSVSEILGYELAPSDLHFTNFLHTTGAYFDPPEAQELPHRHF